MTTDALIARLASGAGPAPRLMLRRDLSNALIAGLVLTSVASLGARGLVPEAMWTGAALWTKLVYALALAAGAVWLFRQLAFPARDPASGFRAVLVVGAAMAAVGTMAVLDVPAAGRLPYLMGKTALICPWAILLLSIPLLAGLFRLLKRYAPTRLRWAGFASGLIAGSVAAAGYALSCVEHSLGFVALWYSVGILLSAALGALLGPRLLRW